MRLSGIVPPQGEEQDDFRVLRLTRMYKSWLTSGPPGMARMGMRPGPNGELGSSPVTRKRYPGESREAQRVLRQAPSAAGDMEIGS